MSFIPLSACMVNRLVVSCVKGAENISRDVTADGEVMSSVGDCACSKGELARGLENEDRGVGRMEVVSIIPELGCVLWISGGG